MTFYAEKVHKSVLERFHVLFVQHRNRLGLTLEQIAENCGVSISTVKKWNQGLAMPGIDNLVPLCILFGEEFVNDFIALAGYTGAFKTQDAEISDEKLIGILTSATSMVAERMQESTFNPKSCKKALTSELSKAQSVIGSFLKRKELH